MDCIRDSRSGRLYIVDVNKTCAGPPNAIGLRDHVWAIRAIGQDLSVLPGATALGSGSGATLADTRP